MPNNQNKRTAKIYYALFDNEKINREGWNSDYGILVLSLRNPIGNTKAIDGINNILNINAFKCIGEINVKNEDDAFHKLQNVYNSHELNNRSMSVGDVIIYDNEGFVVESIGFSKLNKSQLEQFKKI